MVTIKLMIPKVRFVYAPIYDMVMLELGTGLKRYDAKVFGKISKLVWDNNRIIAKRRYASKLQRHWDMIDKKVLSAMAAVSHLRWKDDSIKCYIMDSVQSFSDPMTIRASGNLENDIESAIHELGHSLETQNLDRMRWDKYYRTFKGEIIDVKHHILLHAILKLTYLRAFGPVTTRRYIEMYKDMPRAYTRAWEIVEQYGAENLVRDFIKK